MKYINYFDKNVKNDLDIMEKNVNKYPINIGNYTDNKDFVIKMIKRKPEVY